MNNDDIHTENISGEIPQRAVSLYGQGEGMDDFPVLKAFQQYIDAEQEKARKRVMTLGIIFGAVLVVVIAVFMFLIYGINLRNQALSDRLVEYAMKESERRQAVAPPVQSGNDAALKAITETLVGMQKKMQESASKPVQTATAADPEQERKAREIERAKLQLEAERKRLAEEKERLRQIEIDRQRRKLYPEYYGEEEADAEYRSRRQSPSRNRTRTLTDEDIREILREAYPDADESETKPTRTKKSRKAERKAEPVEDEEEESLGEAIEYFKDDEYTIPVDVKGSSSKVKFTVPVD